MKKVEYIITPWKRNGSSRGCSSLEEAKRHFKEMSALLKSDEMLTVNKIDSEDTELNWAV